MRRFALLLGLLLALGAPVPGQAATEASQGCDAFPWVQTYRTWGPASHYGLRVTVVYQAEACVEGPGSLEVAGTATVHLGGKQDGDVLDVRPFTNLVTWSGDDFQWWSCMDAASYSWQIEDLYRFEAAATAGAWTLVVSPGPDGTLDWSHQAC